MKYTESGTNFYHSVGYEYDSLNNLTSLVEIINGVEHSTTYTYDDDNRVSEIDTDATTIIYTYDEYGRVTKKEMGIYSYEYTYATNGDGAPTGQILWHDFYKNGNITPWGYSYTYDDNGNILTARDAVWSITYAYDSANQLIYEHNPWVSRIWEWTYDDAGNITSRKEYARTNGAKGDLLDTVVYTYDNTEWGDLLTSYDGEPLYYDTIGNLIRDANWDYTWEQGRQLTKMKHGFYAWEFTYDSNGMRTSRTSGTTTYHYVYNGSQLVQMTVGANTLYFTYDANGLPATVTQNGTTYYYALNAQGDVIGIYTESGTDVCMYVYDAWGNPVYTSNNSSYTIDELNPLRYRGYVFDQDTGLYYLQSRYYNPEWGRFINADAFVSTGQGILGNNMFAYCGNNPVSRADDGGECWHIIAGAAVGAIVGAVATAVDAVKEDGWDALTSGKTWAKMGVSAICGGINGVVASSGAHLIVGGIVGGATGFVESLGHELIDNNGEMNEESWTEVGTDAIVGFLGGLSGGFGATYGNKYMAKQKARLLKHIIPDGLEKAGNFYLKMTMNYSKQFVSPTLQGIAKGWVGGKVASYGLEALAQ